MEIKKDFSFAEVCALINIYKCRKLNFISWNTICKEIKIPVTHPVYRKVFDYLKETGAIQVVEIIGPTKILKMDIDLLTDIIDHQEVLLFFIDYAKSEHIFQW